MSRAATAVRKTWFFTILGVGRAKTPTLVFRVIVVKSNHWTTVAAWRVCRQWVAEMREYEDLEQQVRSTKKLDVFQYVPKAELFLWKRMEKRNLVTDAQHKQNLRRKHFSSLLCPAVKINSTELARPISQPMMMAETFHSIHNYEEKRLFNKKKKAAGATGFLCH